MPEPVDSRVAVYIDFDNIVISRYAQVHPTFKRDQLRNFTDDPAMAARLTSATVDIGAILDYASSFGTIVISRAYADWSLPVNASYQRQLISRAVDLTQMFHLGDQKRGGYSPGRRRSRRPLPTPHPHARGDRGRRLRLHRTRSAVQTSRPLRGRDRGGRGYIPSPRGGV